MTPEERAAWVASTKEKFAALPPDEQARRLHALVEVITPDLVIADVDGDTLTLDDVSSENERALCIEACSLTDGDEDASVALRFDEARAARLYEWLGGWLGR